MYATISSFTDEAPDAWRVDRDPASIWIGARAAGKFSLSLPEARQLVVALQREIACAEAETPRVSA